MWLVTTFDPPSYSLPWPSAHPQLGWVFRAWEGTCPQSPVSPLSSGALGTPGSHLVWEPWLSAPERATVRVAPAPSCATYLPGPEGEIPHIREQGAPGRGRLWGQMRRGQVRRGGTGQAWAGRWSPSAAAPVPSLLHTLQVRGCHESQPSTPISCTKDSTAGWQAGHGPHEQTRVWERGQGRGGGRFAAEPFSRPGAILDSATSPGITLPPCSWLPAEQSSRPVLWSRTWHWAASTSPGPRSWCFREEMRPGACRCSAWPGALLTPAAAAPSCPDPKAQVIQCPWKRPQPSLAAHSCPRQLRLCVSVIERIFPDETGSLWAACGAAVGRAQRRLAPGLLATAPSPGRACAGESSTPPSLLLFQFGRGEHLAHTAPQQPRCTASGAPPVLAGFLQLWEGPRQGSPVLRSRSLCSAAGGSNPLPVPTHRTPSVRSCTCGQLGGFLSRIDSPPSSSTSPPQREPFN